MIRKLYDLALSANGDLIFAANRDLAGVSGTDRVEQCIRTRIKIPRGSWVHDINKRIGSRVHRTLSHTPDKVANELPIFIREALDGMDEITIDDIQIKPSDETGRSVIVTISYSVLTLPDGGSEPDASASTENLILALPL